MQSSYHKEMPLTISEAEGTFQWMKKSDQLKDIHVVPVTLKPLFGMPPGLYLTILYVLILLIVLFLVGFLPGIVRSGRRVTFTSDLAPALVTVDGKYIGSAPVTAFIEPGEHEVVFSYEDIVAKQLNFSVDHPVFFTWLVPRKQQVASGPVFATQEELRAYLHRMFDHVVGWSRITDFDDRYHRPPLASQVATSLVQHPLDNTGELAHDFMLQSMNFITSEAARDDVASALQILESKQLADQLLFDVFDVVNQLFTEGTAQRSIGTSGETETYHPPLTQLAVSIGDIESITGFSIPAQTVTIGTEVPLAYPGVQEMSSEVEITDFNLAAHEVSEYLWAHFVADQPYWAKSNIEQLIADGMVDEQYLAGVYPTVTVFSQRPIRNISWYASQAFVQWLSDITGKQVFIPSVAQWEAATQSNVHGEYQLSLTTTANTHENMVGLFGGVWEFTQDSFIPLQRYTEIPSIWESSLSDVVLKGGSYLNDPASITSATVGVMQRSACSETTGLRIAWTE
jgi:hypothetical protein